MPKKTYPITPMGKPTWTKRDKWKPRPEIERWHSFRDMVRHLGLRVPFHFFHVTFILPMPKSWSKKKKLEMDGQAHMQKPDADNLCKALFDSALGQYGTDRTVDDCKVWDYRVTKLWGKEGKIIIDDPGGNSEQTKNSTATHA